LSSHVDHLVKLIVHVGIIILFVIPQELSSLYVAIRFYLGELGNQIICNAFGRVDEKVKGHHAILELRFTHLESFFGQAIDDFLSGGASFNQSALLLQFHYFLLFFKMLESRVITDIMIIQSFIQIIVIHFELDFDTVINHLHLNRLAQSFFQAICSLLHSCLQFHEHLSSCTKGHKDFIFVMCNWTNSNLVGDRHNLMLQDFGFLRVLHMMVRRLIEINYFDISKITNT
jgi:hypothetical protein